MKKIKYSNSRLLLNQKGFSLIELIIILVIIGIMIAASSSRLKDITTNARVGASINQITGDIDQAKTISMSLRSQIQIIFNQNNDTYAIYKDGILYNDFPGSENGIVNLLGDDNNGDVDITSVNLNGSNTLTFDKWGNCLQSGTIVLNDDRQIQIKNLTGHWEIIN